jgi:hypothetical protein
VRVGLFGKVGDNQQPILNTLNCGFSFESQLTINPNRKEREMSRRVVMCCHPKGEELHKISCGNGPQIANNCGIHLAMKEFHREVLFRKFMTPEEIRKNKILQKNFGTMRLYLAARVRKAKKDANM